MAGYKTWVKWKGEHKGHLNCGNGAEMDFSAPPALYGSAGVMTPEDAFVSAVNMCFHLVFLWTAERFKISLISYECEAEGITKDLVDKTSIFEKIILKPKITVRSSSESEVKRAIKSAEKYSLIIQSIKSELILEPEITT
ncbi:MAG: OsmC family protein [Firmicutes bacterium]|nr:OsmC family protein [Bacillota bacterium]